MTLRALSSGVLLLIAGISAPAQGPINDNLTVNFTQPVIVAGQTLAPGEYRIRQIPTPSNPRLLEFTSDNGTRVEATASAFAALDNLTRQGTKVILQQRGTNYHIHQVWLEGKDYGYEFVPGDAQMAATPAQPGLRMTATYQAAEPPKVAEETREETTIAQAAPPPAPAPEPAPAPPVQAQPEPAPAPEPAPEPAPVQTPAMPDTAAGWPAMMAAGFMLTAAGIVTRRYTR